MARIVGLSRNIKLRWLNKVLELVQEGLPDDEIKNELHEYLSFEINSKDNLRKTRDILLNIWVYSKKDNELLWNEAVELTKKYPDDRLAIHWAMMILAYPVLVDVSILFSKLFEFQDIVTLAQLKEKMFDEWGERTTLFHSIDKIAATMKDMEVIKCDKPGKYYVNKRDVRFDLTTLFMLKIAMTVNEKGYYAISELENVRYYFAFNYHINNELLHEQECFVLSNFGDQLTVSLK